MSTDQAPDAAKLAGQLGELAVTVDRLDRQAKAQNLELLRQKQAQDNLAREQIAAAARAALARSGSEPASAIPVVEWMTVEDPDRAVTALLDLYDWVRRVWAQYDPIAVCWAWHPQVVAELLACKRVWVAAGATTAPALASADWHGRFRIASQKALAGRLGACNSTTGHTSGEDLYSVQHLDLAAYAEWWARCHGAPDDGAAAPGLTLRDD